MKMLVQDSTIQGLPLSPLWLKLLSINQLRRLSKEWGTTRKERERDRRELNIGQEQSVETLSYSFLRLGPLSEAIE